MPLKSAQAEAPPFNCGEWFKVVVVAAGRGLDFCVQIYVACLCIALMKCSMQMVKEHAAFYNNSSLVRDTWKAVRTSC